MLIYKKGRLIGDDKIAYRRNDLIAVHCDTCGCVIGFFRFQDKILGSVPSNCSNCSCIKRCELASNV